MIAPGHSFFAELKRRRVVRAALLYGATVFALLQFADLVIEPLGLPAWTLTLVIVLAGLGFPLAVVLAWVFDVAPEAGAGSDAVKATHAGAAGAGASTRAGEVRWLGGRTIAAIVVLLGAGAAAGWLFKPSGPSGAVRADGAATLAVLPFENLSGAADAAPFVAGLHDDLLTRLSRVGALRVIARASVKQYEGGSAPVRQIAQELGVASVLSGGVQRSGEKVRVNVQLVDGATEQQLWAERFDRDLTAADLFAIQSEITEAIALALSARLTADERAALARAPTENDEAYELFLRGHAAFEAAQLGAQDYRPAVRLYGAATQADAGFAAAWARFAAAWMFAYYWRNEEVDDLAPARDAVARARAIDPDLPDAYWAQALVHFYGTVDLEAALAEVSRVQPDRTGSADVLLLTADLESRVGRPQVALEMALDAVELDPRSPATAARVAAHLRQAGRTVEAAALIDGALAYSPGAITLHLAAADLLMSEGDWEGAKQRMRTGFRVVPDGAARLVEALLPRIAWIDSPHLMGYLFELEEFRTALERAMPSDAYEPGSYHLAKARLQGLATRTEQARAHYDSARVAAAAGVEEQRRVGRPQVAYYLAQLAFAHAGLGRFPEAIAAAEEAVRLRPYAEDRWDGAWALTNLAAVHVLAGELDRALEVLTGILGPPGDASPGEALTSGVLRAAPFWAPLRGLPRFEQLLRDAEARG